MSRLARSATILLAAVAVGVVAATSAWGQDATPTPSPTASPTPSETPPPSPTPTPTPAPSPTPTSEPSPTPSATPTPRPTPSPSGRPSTQGTGGAVALQLAPSSTALEVGDRLRIDVRVTNDTPEDKDLTLSLTLPEQLVYVESDPPGFIAGGGPPPLGEFVGVNLGVVPAGSTARATFSLEASSATPDGGAEVLFEVSGDGEADSETLVIDVLEDEAEPADTLELVAPPPDAVLGQVGDRLDYHLTVSNAGEEPLRNVVVVERVPGEVHVIAAPLVKGVDAVQVGRFLDKEDVVWVMDELAPHERVRLPWSGIVRSAGDLVAEASARAKAQKTEPVKASAISFLASPDAPLAPVNPPFAPIVKRVAIEVPVRGGLAATTPGVLPFTGMNTWTWAILGALIVLLGLTLYRFGSPKARGRRVPAGLAILSLIAAACVSSDQEPRATGTPEVKGRRIERRADGETRVVDPRGENAEEPPGADPGDDQGPSDDDGDGSVQPEPNDRPDDGDGAAQPPPTEPAPPVATGETVTRLVTREVTLEDLPVNVAPSISGSSGAFGWDEGSRTVTSATSSRTVVGGSPLSVVTTVHDTGGTINVEVSLLNGADQERVAVDGRFVHEVGSGLARLASDRIDTVLSPGGRVTASFQYLLPSGTYKLSGVFLATG